MKCTLCESTANLFFTDATNSNNYFRCPNCDLTFLDPAKYLNSTDELARYELHDNNVESDTYKSYLSPLADWVKSHAPAGASGLDYGCGDGPLLAQMLEAEGYQITLFDPYFYPDHKFVNNQYDFIIAVETAEHFYSPAVEFKKLRTLLKANGGIGIVTALLNDSIDFKSWHYRRDPTHVCFYSQKTFNYLKTVLNFSKHQSDCLRMNWLS